MITFSIGGDWSFGGTIENGEGVTTPGAGESACDVWLGGAVCSGNWASTIEVGNCIFDSDISTV